MTPTASRAAALLVRSVGRRGPAISVSASSVSRMATVDRSSVRTAATLSAGDALTKLATELPHKDVIRYQHKNIKWSLKHVDYHSDSLANGFIDYGFQPGDKVLSWLPLHFGEQHILQFACSKAGLVLYHLDPKQAITDKAGATEALKRALEVTEANILVSQEAGDDVNYVKLCEDIIPELRIFDCGEGMPFFTPRFPHLRVAIHTGFDIQDKRGMEPLKHMLLPAGTLKTRLRDLGMSVDGATPLMGELATGKDGMPVKGKVLTNEEVVSQGVWPEMTGILKKEYQEIEGVGVVF
uniref:AMP-dependent synthetase/ligase domain-containing protein n=1 Tax=Trieres chinensis TaxID=1514140 RepID=A0A6U1YWV1_TRICV|mmetsp:Transcript_4085/g.8657  ORF Transcript_4085/g.8657 Transcript_4085/m.8657 type:complete len:296 (+) Transcript_4085:62-949(+)|eukprot:CAMPEP_0183306488 /NCGR_PEP_ID=MMETSP0160_2-20130417/11788_1 /TAXON_ID=2839 ORGANISM="Odontella Sinensis, Strain Grunow 1884" /NCGR_SAMPLE_ID=MMETSP0160_2 /ASSEMBLY_ACC=CAM_ASM_000250 /LENGTH=295 /DNA_ID=CAMNT_0025469871 /DNA_START=59 /DNA_END=946 /DNA_ORIENTATION=+